MCASIGLYVGPSASAEAENVYTATFFDSTETAYRIADHLYREDSTAHPLPPVREFVTDAGDAHERLLSGRNPIVGMSLDDVISLVEGGDPRANDLIIAGVHTGFLQLITQPEIADVGELRSQKVAVDTDTGYAIALTSRRLCLVRRSQILPSPRATGVRGPFARDWAAIRE